MTNAVIPVVAKTATTTKTDAVELSAKAKKALAAFNKAKQAEAKAKALKAQAEAILREALGEAKAGAIDGVIAVRVVNGSNTHFDREMMKSLYPEVYEATIRSTDYDYLKTL